MDINSPSKSLKVVLLIFTKEKNATKFERGTEEFYNPEITKVEATVDGSPKNCMLRTWNTVTMMMKL